MGLEAATYVDDLTTTNPVSGDNVSQGDDHLRLLKTVLKATFPNATKALRFPEALAKTANYTVLSADQNALITADSSGGAFALTLPTLASTDDGWWCFVVKTDSSTNAVTVTATINGASNYAMSTQYAGAFFVWSGSAWYTLRAEDFAALTALTSPATGDVLKVLDVSANGFRKITLSDVLKVLSELTEDSSPDLSADFLLSYDTSAAAPKKVKPSSILTLSQPLVGGRRNLVIQNNSVTPNTQVDVDADEVTVGVSGGIAYRLASVNLTINAAVNGANGLDSGGLANNSWYYIFVIYNPTTATVAGLLSTSSSSPTLPSGYTALGRFGAIPTDGSATFYRVVIRDDTAYYKIVTSSNTNVLRSIATGSSGTPSNTSPSWTEHSIASLVPPTAREIFVVGVNARSGGSAAHVQVAPSTDHQGQSSTDNPPYLAINSSQATVDSVWMPILGGSIAYASGGSGGAAYCGGWRDNL